MKIRFVRLLGYLAIAFMVAPTSGSVYFADAILKEAVEDTLNVIDPTPTDMLGLQDLTHIRSYTHYQLKSGIEDLTGLEYALHLRSLNLRRNQLTDLSPLANLVQLEQLNLSQNQISDLAPLSGLTKLTRLDIHGNRISDVADLSGLTHLEFLILRINRISNITPLTALKKLRHLDLYFNLLTGCAPDFSGLTSLGTLDLRANSISRICVSHCLRDGGGVFDIRKSALAAEAYCTDLVTLSQDCPLMNILYDPNPIPADGVSASDGTYSNKVRVAWDEVCNGPHYTSYYRVYRALSQDEPKLPISTWQLGRSYDDTDVTSGNEYYYEIRTATDPQGLDAGDFSATALGWVSL